MDYRFQTNWIFIEIVMWPSNCSNTFVWELKYSKEYVFGTKYGDSDLRLCLVEVIAFTDNFYCRVWYSVNGTCEYVLKLLMLVMEWSASRRLCHQRVIYDPCPRTYPEHLVFAMQKPQIIWLWLYIGIYTWSVMSVRFSY